MLPAQNARIPFLTKKRSFDLAWGAWAGILAVMTAVGAALTGSQILMMYPRAAKVLEFKYPSMPRSEKISSARLGKDSLAVFWGAQGVVFGLLQDVIAPQGAGRLMVRNSGGVGPKDLLAEIELWCRKNLKEPVRVLAVGESPRLNRKMTFADIADLTTMIEEINKKIFSDSVRPAVVRVDLVNPM